MINLADELLPEVLIAVPGCPDTTAERALARSARQFCMDTQAWRLTLEDLPLTQGDREVPLNLPPEVSLYRPYWVTMDERQLLGVSESRLSTEEGRPTGYVLSPLGSLYLDCPPDAQSAEKTLSIHLSVVPNRGEMVMPEQLQNYFDAVQMLATAYLVTMPGVEWRDRHAASDLFSLYQNVLPEARRFAQQRNQSIHRTVNYGGI